VRQWLKAGVVEDGRLAPTEEGAPQGGVISPLLLNVALHGMEAAAGVRYYDTGTNAGKTVPDCPVVVRYADDLIALCHSRAQAEQVKARLAEWLAPRGLVFNEDKTRITHLEAGVDFLGFNIRRYANGKLLTKPSNDAVRRLRKRLSAEAKALRGANADAVISKINPIIVGWAAYYRIGGVQTRVQRTGRPCVEAGLQVGQAHTLEQADALGDRPVLRQVQPGQAGRVGVRKPANRLLPAQVRLDTDRPAPDGGRNGVSGRPGPDRLLGPAPPPQQPSNGHRHARAPTRPARPVPVLPRAAAARRP
jgi:hypothetical protein